VEADSVVSVGPDYSHSRMVVGVASDSADGVALGEGKPVGADLADRFARALAGANVSVTYYATPRAYETSRYYETSPFYGGSAIKLQENASATTGAGCSAAFAWNPPSGYAGQYMITASHCANPHSGVFQKWVNRVSSDGAWHKIGKIEWSSGGKNGTLSGRKGDVSVYKLTGSKQAGARIYTGTYNTSSSSPVKGYTTMPQGWQGSTLLLLGLRGSSVPVRARSTRTGSVWSIRR